VKRRFGRVSFKLSFVLGVLLGLASHAPTLAAQSTGTFTPTGKMTTARLFHTATLLLNGKVLITGGTQERASSAELYDPATGTFMPTGDMTTPRILQSATLLRDGRVLIAGGGTADLYDPSTGIFTPTGNMVTPQYSQTGTLLDNGKVLITGGWYEMSDCCPIATHPEIYDPTTGTFAETGNYAYDGSSSVYGTSSLVGVPATLLPNGTVLIAAEPAAELYDPATGTFTLTGTMATRPFGQTPGYISGRTATLLKNGKVLLTGGEHEDIGIFNNAELYDPSTGTFTETGHMTIIRAEHSATLLADGKVLIAGAQLYSGIATATTELYDPNSGTFSAIGNMNTARFWHTATLLNDGQVLVAGGESNASPRPTSSAELYTPAMLANVQVVVQTDPAGLQITVDGMMFTAPQNFSWSRGTNHTIATTSPQGGGGNRHVFANWNGAGAISHIVAPTVPTTYTANFTTQYLLTLGVSPSGGGIIGASPSSSDGFYNSGTSVQLSASANFGYAFLMWSGDATGFLNPVSVAMSAPRNVAANFNLIAVSGLRFVPVVPCRVADTRNAPGPFGGPVLAGNSTRNFTIPASSCGVPVTALAYSLNTTVVPTSGTLSYLSAWPTGQPQPLVSTLNSLDGRIKANATIVGAGNGGAVSVFVSNDSHVILDLNGYFAPPVSAPTGLAFYPVTPCRVMDTRHPDAPLGGPILNGGASRTVPVQSSLCGLPSGAAAYSLNMTVVPTGGLDYLTTWPTGSAQPLVSTLNDQTGTIVANAAIVPAGAGGSIDVFATHQTDLIIDINGYFAPPGAGGLLFYATTPCRIVDTRNPSGPFGGPALLGQRDFSVLSSPCGGPPTTKAYSLNVTVVPSGPLGFLSLWPSGQPQPSVSTLNAPDAGIVSNAAIVPTSSGPISAFSLATTDLILDLNGFFAP